jgi:hypothetical protein
MSSGRCADGDERKPPARRTVATALARTAAAAASIWPANRGVPAFWCWNGSISLSKTQAILHPDFSLHIGNASLALFLVGALFPLHALLALRDFAAAAARRRVLLLVPLIVFAAVCWLFHVDHVYNFADPAIFIRNALLLAVDRSPIWRARGPWPICPSSRRWCASSVRGLAVSGQSRGAIGFLVDRPALRPGSIVFVARIPRTSETNGRMDYPGILAGPCGLLRLRRPRRAHGLLVSVTSRIATLAT